MTRDIKLRGANAVDNLVVLIQRPSGYAIANNVVAVGKYETTEGRWVFEAEEDALKQWLESVFSQPLNSKHGQIIPQSSEFVEQIKNTVMTRRGLVLTIK